MKKRFLTLVVSYLLLAAFIGSAEAKTINANYYGIGIIRFPGSVSNGTADSGWIFGEPTEGMEWLLAYYYGKEADIPYIEIEQSTDSSDEDLAAKEESEKELASAEGMLDHNFARLAYGDSLYDQTAALDQSGVYGYPSENIPQADFGTIVVQFYNPPPPIIYHSNKEERTPLDSPSIFPTPSPALDKPPMTADIPPAGFHPPPTAIPIGEPLTPVLPNDPGKPGYLPTPKPGQEKPNDGKVSPPAPVPEPATMLLLTTSLMGLAFTRMRRK